MVFVAETSVQRRCLLGFDWARFTVRVYRHEGEDGLGDPAFRREIGPSPPRLDVYFN